MRRSLIVIAVGACLLAACSSSGSNSSTSTGTEPATSGTPSSATSSSAPSTTKPADFEAAKIKLTLVAQGLNLPVALAPRPGTSTLYIADQDGEIRALRGTRLVPTPVLDIRGHVTRGNEQGLLGITFSTDGSHLYIDFTDKTGDTHVQEFAMHGDVADTASMRELLFQKQPFPNHNGGEVVTGPDGMLYIGFGDGGSPGDPNNNGQNKNTLLGKILRINPKAGATGPYTAPANNPFVGQANERPEIWQWGLRNPWRFSFDRATGDMWIGDVGQGEYEEVDVAKAGTGGVNFGWSQREGKHKFKGPRPAGAVDPVYEYTHTDGGVAITGGYVYRGKNIPDLVGSYLFTDYSEGAITALKQTNGHITGQKVLKNLFGGVSSFGQDNNGELYALDLNGKVYRIDQG